MEEGDTDWERAHLIGLECCEGGRHRLGESAFESGSGVRERDADWKRAHMKPKRNEYGREMNTGRERT